MNVTPSLTLIPGLKLTLGRVCMLEQIETWPKDLFVDPGRFNLEFGLSDKKWQYAETFEVLSVGFWCKQISPE